MGSANFSVSKSTFWETDLLRFDAFLCALHGVAARNRTRLTLCLYMVPLYFIAGVSLSACACLFTNPIKNLHYSERVISSGWP